IVPSLEAVSPVPAVGVTLASRGGHAVAHAPVHALMVPESALNRYRVRPLALTRIDPRLLLATRTLAVFVGVVVVVVADGVGGGAAVAAAPPPPHAATARATSGITAAPARKVTGLLRVMSLLRIGEHRHSLGGVGTGLMALACGLLDGGTRQPPLVSIPRAYGRLELIPWDGHHDLEPVIHPGSPVHPKPSRERLSNH